MQTLQVEDPSKSPENVTARGIPREENVEMTSKCLWTCKQLSGLCSLRPKLWHEMPSYRQSSPRRHSRDCLHSGVPSVGQVIFSIPKVTWWVSNCLLKSDSYDNWFLVGNESDRRASLSSNLYHTNTASEYSECILWERELYFECILWVHTLRE